MKKLLTFLTLLTLFFTTALAETVTDVLNYSFTGNPGTGYYAWSGKAGSASTAVYAGQSAGNNQTIQLRATNPSGIISTTSGGKVKKVVVSWNTATADGRTLQVYGKNSAYSESADLYDTSKQGTLLGTIVYGTSVSLNISGDYQYIGLRSANSAMYLDEIKITWEEGGSTVETVATPTFSPAAGTYSEAQNVTIACATSGATIYYTTDGNTPTTNSSVYSSAIPVSTTTTIKAIAVKSGMNNSDVATATYTINIPQPSSETRFERIKSTDKLETGIRYLLVYEGQTPAVMGATTTSGTHYGQSVTTGFTLSNGVITLEDGTDAKPLTLGGESGAWTFDLDGKLIGWSSGNSLSSTTNSRTTTWTISFDGNNAVITNTAASDRVIKYNTGSPRFACYTSGQQRIQLYKEVTQQEEVSDLYIVGQVNGNDEDPFDPEEGVELTYSQTNGTYSGDFYCKGMNDGYSYLLFSKRIPADFNNDKSNLYGAGGNGNAWVINESDYGNAIPLYATSSDSFRLPAGLYSVTIALSGAGFQWTDASVTFTTREKTMVINGSQYFEDNREVTMSSNLTEIGGKIYYTTDGSNPSDPNSSRLEYTGAITISETTTFKAVAFVGNLYSAVVEKTFTKTPKTPVITPNGGTITEATEVTITCETTGASIYYTLDGSTPTNVVSETNFLYSEPFTIDETTTVKARAYVGNTYSNGIATAEFVYTEPYVPGEGDFVLVDGLDDLKAGREYIIVTADYNWAMGAIDADAKKATASQDFNISTDHSTVTLTDNSTVNVMKLVDGIEDTDNKYWNLHQANGLNIYLQNTGTGIQENAHGYGLSGYSDEVLINLTTTTNYAIITPGGRQILYQNGSNGAAGVFGHYANSNAGASGYQRIFLYYREGATVPPTGVTLAELCANGVKDNDYVISDKLQAVYAYTKGGNSLLWCKDLGNQSIYPTTIHSGQQIDFMRSTDINYDTEHGVNNGQQDEWDQSNWIVLQFTNPTGPNNIDQMLQDAQDKFIKPGTIKGKLVDDENYILKMDLDMIETLTPADEGYSEEPYNENVYCPANFLPDNLNIHGGIENGDGAETSTQNYFFMNPKVQEVCYITYAQWNEAYSCFTVPSNNGIPGAFQVGWVYQDKPGLEDGDIYKFHAVVHRVGKEGYGPNNPISTKDGMPSIYENITVLPVDLDPATSEIITGINTVDVTGKAVKSVKYVNVAGVVSDVPFQGVNIVVTEYTDGSRTTTKMLRK